MTSEQRGTANRPRPVADLVPGLTKDIFGRKNALFGRMISAWADIAGEETAAHTLPLDLKFQRKTAGNGSSQAVLHLAVRPAWALEFIHQKQLLIERLNIFFGYAAIKDIKIIQNGDIMARHARPAPLPRPLTLHEKAELGRLTADIAEKDLQMALENLGKAMLSRRKAPANLAGAVPQTDKTTG